MFYAKDVNDKLIYIDTIIKQKTWDNLLCPDCLEPVIVKRGNKRHAHFSHKNKLLCDTFQKGETETHLVGKKLLYDYFVGLKANVTLERYYSKISQRADIVVSIENNSVIIEFQCSIVPVHQIIKRTNGYLLLNYRTIWILSYELLTKKRRNIYELTDFLMTFIIFNSKSQPFILFFHTVKKRFVFLQIVAAFSSRKVFAVEVHSKSIFLKGLPPLRKEDAELISTSWYEKNKQSRMWMHRKLSRWKSLLHKLYESKISPSYYPSEVFLPVPEALCLQYSIDLWQLHFFVYVIVGVKVGQIIYIDGIEDYLVKYDHVFKLKEMTYTSLSSKDILLAYLAQLIKLNKLRSVPRGYELISEFVIPNSVEEGAELCSKYCKKIIQNN